MKILLIGSGGREHALAWKLRQSPKVTELFCAPGHGGLAGLATLKDVADGDIPGLAALAGEIKPDLAVIGPEAPLTLGLADRLREMGIPVFGPSAAAARIEGSKAFAKDFMRRHNLPTAAWETFTDHRAALAYVERQKYPLVVKADGLAAGKGVVICQNADEARAALKDIMLDKRFGAAGSGVVVEEFLVGEEASCLAFTDGRTVLPLPSAQDHKAVFDGDQGPNTGGMGAYSPAPLITPALSAQILENILKPAVAGLAADGCPFQGVLYAGLMVTAEGPKLLEFNARFGDPETQPLMMRLKSDLAEICLAAATGRLDEIIPEWDPRPAVCVVMCAPGYPGDYPRGAVVTGVDEASAEPDVMVFLAGVKAEKRLSGELSGDGLLIYQGPGSLKQDEVLLTNGGRVLGVTALGDDLRRARDRAYGAAEKISFAGAHYRRDIGAKAL